MVLRCQSVVDVNVSPSAALSHSDDLAVTLTSIPQAWKLNQLI